MLENSPIETQKLIIESITGTEIPKSVRKLHYILQVKSIGEERIASIPVKFILAISPFGEVDDSDAKYEKSSRPDAWIWSSNFAILFENKTRGKLNKAQLEQHKKLLIGSDRIVRKSWINDVYPVIREAVSKVQNEKGKFLLSEFRRYLEVIGMSRFEGFDKEDFMKKYCDEDDREEFDYLKSKFSKLAEAEREELKQKGLQFRDATSNFGEREIGWYGFYKDYKGPKGAMYSQENAPHFSIFMSAEPIGVCVKLHVMKQPLNDLRAKIKNDQKRQEFFELLKRLNSSDYKNNTKITVSESERSSKPRRAGDWSCEYTVYSGYIDERRLETIAKMLLDNSKKVWFSIYYTFDSKKAEERGEKIVEDIVSIINEWWEIYSFIAESK